MDLERSIPIKVFMFVEDSGRDMALAAGVLSRLGSKGSTVFDSASRAIDHLRSVLRGEAQTPEAIILDLALRSGSGQDVLIEAQRDSKTAKIPVLVWTRTADEIQEKICLNLGARVVLRKTQKGSELRDAVMQLRR